MTPDPIRTEPALNGRWCAHGKWFRHDNGRKVWLNGVTYGPFKPNHAGQPWPEAPRLRTDIAKIVNLGFNVIRTYDPPSAALLDACAEHGLRLMVGVPWTQHADFYADTQLQTEAEHAVRLTARSLRDHPLVIAILIGNEIEKTLVRWIGPDRVRSFLERLIAIVHEEAPLLSAGYSNYPSTEYLLPRNADFVAFNIFLEDRQQFRRYLQRLQIQAGDKPLLITEFGLDSLRAGESAQAEALDWQRQEARAAHIAGSFTFSFTDEWHRGGEDIQDWAFGLVMRDRQEKVVCQMLRNELGDEALMAEFPSEQSKPLRMSVVVCTFNGSATLAACLRGLAQQNYPDYEVLLIDDGSTDAIPQIAAEFPQVRYYRQTHAGLSAARNLGCEQATGEIIAYTDDDCIPDEDWLRELSHAFTGPENQKTVAAGGPNIPPPPRNETEACVGVSPGAPAHVLLNDGDAEHLPGCNLAIRKSALVAVGGFHPVFTTAGDDVDICWRLLQAGGRLRFRATAVVWHHRRFSLKAYIRQQMGYGRAEALLMKHYPERFALGGGARWQGIIYRAASQQHALEHGSIHYGSFGLAPFQGIYENGNAPAGLASWATGVLWLATAAVFLMLGLVHGAIALLGLGMFMVTGGCAWRHSGAAYVSLRRPARSQRFLLAILCLVQPIVRQWARLHAMRRLRAWPGGRFQWRRKSESQATPRNAWDKTRSYWSSSTADRSDLLNRLAILAEENGIHVYPEPDTSSWDLRLQSGNRQWLLTSVTEYQSSSLRLTRVALRRTGLLSRFFPSYSEACVWRLIDSAAREVGMTSGNVQARREALPLVPTIVSVAPEPAHAEMIQS